ESAGRKWEDDARTHAEVGPSRRWTPRRPGSPAVPNGRGATGAVLRRPRVRSLQLLLRRHGTMVLGVCRFRWFAISPAGSAGRAHRGGNPLLAPSRRSREVASGRRDPAATQERRGSCLSALLRRTLLLRRRG